MNRKEFAEAMNEYLENPDKVKEYECEAVGCNRKATQVIQTTIGNPLRLDGEVAVLKLCDMHMRALKRGKRVW